MRVQIVYEVGHESRALTLGGVDTPITTLMERINQARVHDRLVRFTTPTGDAAVAARSIVSVLTTA